MEQRGGRRFGTHLLTRADRVLIGGVLVGIGLLVYWSMRPAQTGEQVSITVEGVWQGTFYLVEPRRLSVMGPLGAAIVEIEAGAVRVARAPCHRQICVGTGWAQRRGAVIACLPNRLLVQVAGRPDSYSLDAVSR